MDPVGNLLICRFQVTTIRSYKIVDSRGKTSNNKGVSDIGDMC